MISVAYGLPELTESGRRRRNAAVLVVTGLLLFSGCEDNLGPPPQPPDGPSAVTACVTADGALVADVNDDGLPDRVADPSGNGAGLTITFGVGSDHETTSRPRDLADHAGEHQEYVRAAVADFDQDGWSDLVVVAGRRQGGDDPIPPKMAELRLGPFSNSGRGQKVIPLDLGATRNVAVADFDHDRYPDLAAYVYIGDGGFETQARLGERARGLGPDTRQFSEMDTETGFDGPVDLPNAGPAPFYPPCPPDDTTG
ncbi:FG-GAP repeat domain-containing protein [Streptomyces sp. NPDC096132]|uniref:FG-GAP repeat domain-containing protein n=1 Tax=Streptomyces sp. NPDC096132 TaxID=3366075 RepID=UPI0038263872